MPFQTRGCAKSRGPEPTCAQVRIVRTAKEHAVLMAVNMMSNHIIQSPSRPLITPSERPLTRPTLRQSFARASNDRAYVCLIFRRRFRSCAQLLVIAFEGPSSRATVRAFALPII